MKLSAASLLTSLAALVLGAAAVAAFAPLAWYPLAWLAAGGAYLLLQRATSPRAGLMLGFAFGLGYFLTGTSWVYVSMSVFGGLPPALAGLATALFCTYLALYPALVGTLFVRLRRRHFVTDATAFAALWVLAEWLRGWLFTGFPWLALGYSQSPPSPLAGYAPIVGVYGVTLVTLLVGAAFAELLRRWFATPCAGCSRVACGTGPLLLAITLLVVGVSLAELRWSEPRGEPLRVALLQGNVPQDLKWRPEKLPESLAIYGRLMHDHPATLTVLPETAIPTFLDTLPRHYLEGLLDHAMGQRGDILFGIAVGEGQRYANAGVSFGASPTQLYAKSHLVPFGEFVPPGFQWFLDLMRIPMGNFMPGPDRQPPLEIAGQKVAVNICYEDVFGSEIIRALPEATLLVNLSNTAWFGDSLAQPQHLQIAQMRALETGRPMLRATNTGMTAVVRPDGVVQDVLPPFTRDALVTEVQGYVGSTPYVRWGNGTILVLALVLIVTTAFARKRQQNQ